jgi:electron transfer flavoprotein alpha subunit
VSDVLQEREATQELCALIVCRGGELPAGATEAFELASFYGVVIGTGAQQAATLLPGPGRAQVIESSESLQHLAALVVPLLAKPTIVVLPASPDGRDLAPMVGMLMNRPVITGITKLKRREHAEGSWEVTAVRSDGLLDHLHHIEVNAIVTLIPGLAGVVESHGPVAITIDGTVHTQLPAKESSHSVVSVEMLAADPTTMDLTEASCIVAGGQGLGGKAQFDQLGRIGGLVGGSLGGTRVASDAGWIPFERQIGTTGVAVNPNVYIAFGISGATQHTSGLGAPDHIISINTDPSCPMMTMSDVAIVSDAKAVLVSLESKLMESNLLESKVQERSS